MKHLSFFTQDTFIVHCQIQWLQPSVIFSPALHHYYIHFHPESVQSVHPLYAAFNQHGERITMLSLFKNTSTSSTTASHCYDTSFEPHCCCRVNDKKGEEKYTTCIILYDVPNVVQSLASVGDMLIPVVLEQLQALQTSHM